MNIHIKIIYKPEYDSAIKENICFYVVHHIGNRRTAISLSHNIERNLFSQNAATSGEKDTYLPTAKSQTSQENTSFNNASRNILCENSHALCVCVRSLSLYYNIHEPHTLDGYCTDVKSFDYVIQSIPLSRMCFYVLCVNLSLVFSSFTQYLRTHTHTHTHKGRFLSHRQNQEQDDISNQRVKEDTMNGHV